MQVRTVLRVWGLLGLCVIPSCVGFVHQEDLTPYSHRIKFPHGSVKVEAWPKGGSLRYRAPWGLYFYTHYEKNTHDAVSFRLISIVSRVQNTNPNLTIVVEPDENGVPLNSERTKRLIKHPGDGNPIDVTFEIETRGKAGTHRSTHTLRFVPKLTSEVITYNPLLDIT